MESQIIFCLEQKVILLTKILDITKQIEIRCLQSDIVLDDFLEQRQAYMERVNKCDRLIENSLNNIPEGRRKCLQQLLKATGNVPQTTLINQQIFALSEKSASLIQRAMSIDKNANKVLRKQVDELREKINESRKTDTSMFYR